MRLFGRKHDPDREDPERVVVMGSTRYQIIDGQLVEVVNPKRRT
jgi:hypothetical protein